MHQLSFLALRHDHDVVAARQRAALIAQLLGFDVLDQTRVATAVSEIVRNGFRYATGAAVTFAVDEIATPQRLVVRVTDRGPGIPRLDEVLAGRYRSGTGMGVGLAGARRLMDVFTVDSSRTGTTVVLEKYLSPRHGPVTPERARAIAEAVEHREPGGLLEEIREQNHALLVALEELQRRQQELVQLNRELEDTNRGVVALYAELDEKADSLRRADELKSRFLSNMTHEFRTPVNSIIGLTNLMIEDREQSSREPEPEVLYIRQAAEQLSDLVNDLLDLAKVEAGKTIVRPAEFEVGELFGALRGMLRPLLLDRAVSLVIEEPEGVLTLHTDAGKVSQILRNLISNALKFTEHGEVRVSAAPADADGTIVFSVSDTGIGIAPDDQPRIFEEFTQLEHPLQRIVKGTGLGLPLSRRLAGLLGGTLNVTSEPAVGSTFTLTIPIRYRDPVFRASEPFEEMPAGERVPLVVLADAPHALELYEQVLRPSAYQLYFAPSASRAEALLDRVRPAAVVLDIAVSDDGWDFLSRLRRSERSRGTPVVFVSSGSDRDKALALGADVYLTRPLDRRRLLDALAPVPAQEHTARPPRVLVIDDEEVARYVIRQSLPEPHFLISEAASAEAGLRLARDERPDVVLLDLIIADGDGRDVLQQLRAAPGTRDIPVIIVTSHALDEGERERLLREADGLLSKGQLSGGTLLDAIRAALRSRSLHGEHGAVSGVHRDS